MVDAWSSTPPSAQEFPHSPTNGFDALLDRIAKYERALADMRNNLLSTAGLSVSTDGLTADRDLTVNGELLVTGATRIEGTLDLPAGIIGNDSLTSPLEIVGVSGYTAGFGLPGANTVLHSEAIVVPSGYTKATVEVTATTSYLGSTGSGDSYVRCQAGVNSTYGRSQTAYLYDTDAITMSAKAVVDLTGLVGGDIIYVRAAGYALGGAKPDVASNTADVAAVAFFTR